MYLKIFSSNIIHGRILNGHAFQNHILNCALPGGFKSLLCQIDPLPLGKGITDFGFTVVTAAIYLLCTASMLLLFVRWFVRIINGIIDRQQTVLGEILNLQKEQSHSIRNVESKLLNFVIGGKSDGGNA